MNVSGNAARSGAGKANLGWRTLSLTRQCFRVWLAVAILATLEACTSGSSVPSKATAEKRAPTPAAEVKLMEGYPDRPYKLLGEVAANVQMTLAMFDVSNARDMVNQRLRSEAAKLGADAVVQVRYNHTSVRPTSWGAYHAKGRAVVFDSP